MSITQLPTEHIHNLLAMLVKARSPLTSNQIAQSLCIKSTRKMRRLYISSLIEHLHKDEVMVISLDTGGYWLTTNQRLWNNFFIEKKKIHEDEISIEVRAKNLTGSNSVDIAKQELPVNKVIKTDFDDFERIRRIKKLKSTVEFKKRHIENYLKLLICNMKKGYGPTETLRKYCESNPLIAQKTLTRWITIFKQKGVEGLVDTRGKKPRKDKQITPSKAKKYLFVRRKKEARAALKELKKAQNESVKPVENRRLNAQ